MCNTDIIGRDLRIVHYFSVFVTKLRSRTLDTSAIMVLAAVRVYFLITEGGP